MNTLDKQIKQLASVEVDETGSVGRLLRYFAKLPWHSPAEGHRLLMEMKVLSLLRENLLSHPEMPDVTLERFPELPGFRVSRGVFSPEFTTDSYLWAKYIAARGLVVGKSVLEMGAGSGIISFMLRAMAHPSFLCAADVNAFAVENLRANAALFGVPKEELLAVESDLFESIPQSLQFDVALWAMPWILRDDPEINRILNEAKNPFRKALLRSAIDPSGRVVCKFITESKRFLRPGGKVLLISSDFIPNEIIIDHAKSEGFAIEQNIFATDVTVVENPEITLDLIQLELTKL
jgi:methylase of polypeptide subunit release factors